MVRSMANATIEQASGMEKLRHAHLTVTRAAWPLAEERDVPDSALSLVLIMPI